MTMTTRQCFILHVLAILACGIDSDAASTDLRVTNVQVQRREHAAVVDVTYDLETVGDAAVTITMSLSTDAGATFPFICQSVTGDVGLEVAPGTGKHIVWAAGDEFPGFAGQNCQLKVTADDGVVPVGFVYVAPGTFTMGSPPDEPGHLVNEAQHVVTLTHGFYLHSTEITNQEFIQAAQWAVDHGYATATAAGVFDNLDGSTVRLMTLGSGGSLASDVSFTTGLFSCVNPDHPVNWVTWYGAATFCDWLSLQQSLPRAYEHVTWQCYGGTVYGASGYRLPTEAEFEYSCRAGSVTAFYSGPITNILSCTPVDPNLDQIGWYCGNAGPWTHPAAMKQVNAWGLYDLSGNCSEWCNDLYNDFYGGDAVNPVGPAVGVPSTYRVYRGGNFENGTVHCRSAHRHTSGPTSATYSIGFRVVRTAD